MWDSATSRYIGNVLTIIYFSPKSKYKYVFWSVNSCGANSGPAMKKRHLRKSVRWLAKNQRLRLDIRNETWTLKALTPNRGSFHHPNISYRLVHFAFSRAYLSNSKFSDTYCDWQVISVFVWIVTLAIIIRQCGICGRSKQPQSWQVCRQLLW